MLSLSGATVLITGGTGSFGGTVARALLSGDIGEVRVLSRDEAKQHAMSSEVRDPRLRFFLGDVRDEESMRPAIRGADLVFHAAALKQVPSCESFPLEAVKTNVLGSSNVVRLLDEYRVPSAVFLSTDKAVYPINAMGQSKALMERVVQAETYKDHPTKMAIVRYGNVMCSRGSVIPLFAREILAGRPVPITNPTMTRFMMSLSDSVDLVLKAYLAPERGALLVRKAPAATVDAIATGVALALGRSSQRQEVGVRAGEKLHETLLTREELARAQEFETHFSVSPFSSISEERASQQDVLVDYTSDNTDRLTSMEVATILSELPEFSEYMRLRTNLT